jgi:hypothetical protein
MTRHWFRLSAATMLALAVAAFDACSDSTSTGHGTLVVKLTDAPFPTDSVDSVNIFVVRVDARIADADSGAAATGASDDSAEMGGWQTVATPNDTIDLLAYQGGATLTIGSATLAEGTYSGFRLVIDPSKSWIRLKSGGVLSGTTNPNVTFPSASRSGLKIVLSSPVTIQPDGTTTMIVDFDLANSFVMRGASITQNGLLFTPVIQATVSVGAAP